MTDEGLRAGPAEPPRGAVDRELILASAGSGKTYQLSSRLIGLLALEVPAQEILASTFTRKAAGEILERVLLRLADAALAEEEARRLGTEVAGGALADRLTREGAARVLLQTVRQLHRFQVHTLDAFFHKVVRAFTLELGLPAEWRVSDEPTEASLRAAALDEALEEGEVRPLMALAQAVGRGDADRSVHELLVEQVSGIHRLYRERVPSGESQWTAPAEFNGPGPDALRAALESLREAALPTTRKGTPRRHWLTNRNALVSRAEAEDWSAFLDVTLVARVLHEEPEFDGVPIPDEIRGPMGTLLQRARARLGRELWGRVTALGAFLPEYDERLRNLQRARGAYGFSDLTYALLVGDPMGSGLEEVYYRLDGRIRHVLLDEFQDTSTAQWAVLEPLVGEILSGYEGERAAFVVADPKQSIYGWRDGEPRILDLIRSRYGLEPSSLARSWRSSPPVLELVNRVFEGIRENPVLDDEIRPFAGRWGESFELHESAVAHHPGYVSVETGPSGEEEAPHPLPLRTRWAARRVAEIHEAVPGASVGVLVPKNDFVARMIAALRDLGLEPSEEGGVPVTDAPSVLAALALLRMADHPADRISRYLAAHTPLAPEVGLEDWRSDAHAAEVARRLRERLLVDGYGTVLSEWGRTVAPLLGPRDRARFRRLVELAFRWDAEAGLRPGDFVRMAEADRAETGGVSPIRVMTIHRAKGLDFDVVVLPELEESAFTPGSAPPFLGERAEGGAGPVVRVVPGVNRQWEPLFPEVAAASEQYRESRTRDSLSALYVALTRARFAVHLLMEPDPKGTSRSRSPARLIRHALLPDGKDAPPNTLLWSAGEERWWESPEAPERLTRPVPGATGPRPPSAPRVRVGEPGRRRLLLHQTPSELEGEEGRTLSEALRPPPPGALDRGSLIHLWLERMAWIEEGWEGGEQALLALARERFPAVGNPSALLEELRRWIQAPEIRPFLSREAHPPGTTVERELPFLARDGDGLLRGSADRVLRIPEGEGERIVVVDWKTDRVPPPAIQPPQGPGALAILEERLRAYRPQMEAYRRSLARLFGVEEERAEAYLVFLEGGVARKV